LGITSDETGKGLATFFTIKECGDGPQSTGGRPLVIPVNKSGKKEKKKERRIKEKGSGIFRLSENRKKR
jgi:hypothetical protein